MLAVFDVDGVVADVRHRLKYLARTPKDWKGFFAAAAADPPLETGVGLAREWADGHDLVWLTGRPENLRRVTERWLRDQGLPVDRLIMRPANDRRAARLFKADRVKALSAETAVAVIVDDDPDVIDELRRRGWPVYLADWVPRAAALAEAQEAEGRT